MKLYLIKNVENGNGLSTIQDKSSRVSESIEISKEEALKLLYSEIDPDKDYSISEYKLTGPNTYGRFGIDYK